ncbi:hypothetical protein NDU88_005497 [Pleurodeles waltl]|uniref:Uncharacterized protein n=1 Tax=Pleurodeles waltl TaxID=8319 RepID=A0AAV7RLL9_PLEWA|nr:hypothetical protein NDU88_005497 [Pleurodeles waltl]
MHTSPVSFPTVSVPLLLKYTKASTQTPNSHPPDNTIHLHPKAADRNLQKPRPAHMGRVSRTQPSTSATQFTRPVLTAPTRGVKGSRPHVLKGKKPAPACLKGRETAPAGRKCKELAPAVRKSKEPASVGKKSKDAAPADRKGKEPGPGTVIEPPPPTIVVHLSEGARDGQVPPPTSSTTTVQPSEGVGNGQEPPTTSSPTTVQPSEVAGDGQEPPPPAVPPLCSRHRLRMVCNPANYKEQDGCVVGLHNLL